MRWPSCLKMTDEAVYSATSGLVSGHSLKHVVASFAAWPVVTAWVSHGKSRAEFATALHAVHESRRRQPQQKSRRLKPCNTATKHRHKNIDMKFEITTRTNQRGVGMSVNPSAAAPSGRSASSRASQRAPEPVCALEAAPLCAVFLDAVFGCGQRQPVQVRLHRDGHLPAQRELAAARNGRAGDWCAVHPAVFVVLGPPAAS